MINYEELKPYMNAVLLTKLIGRLNQPLIIVKFFALLLVCWALINFFLTGVFEIFIFAGALVLFFITPKDWSKEYQLIVIFFVWNILKAILFSFIAILSFVRYYSENLDNFLYLFFLGILWIPSLEFLKFNRKNPYPLFIFRVFLTIIIFLKYSGNI